MENIREPALNAVSIYSPVFEVVFREMVSYVLEKLGDNESCKDASSDECRQIKDLLIYHSSMQLFSISFEQEAGSWGETWEK